MTVNPRIQRLRNRFSPSRPKARYLAAALALEGSLVAMSFLVPGGGGLAADAVSESLQIETAPREVIEELADPVAEPDHDVAKTEPDAESQVTLTRFTILDSEPLLPDLLPDLLLDRPRPAENTAPVDPEPAPKTWLRRIVQRKIEKTTTTSSTASVAQVRLEPLEGHNPKPAYPAAAVRLGLEGSLLFRMHIGADGKVVRLELVQQDCVEILARAAAKALLQWKFQGGPGIYSKRIVFNLVDRD